MFTVFCSHHLYLVEKCLSFPKETPYSLSSHPIPPLPFLSLWISLFQNFHVTGIIHYVTALVHLGCYNRTPYFSQLQRPESPRLILGQIWCMVRACFLVHEQLSSHCILNLGRDLSGISFITGMNHFPKDLPSHTITLGVRISRYKFCKDINILSIAITFCVQHLSFSIVFSRFIYVIACTSTLLLFRTELCYRDRPYFVHVFIS